MNKKEDAKSIWGDKYECQEADNNIINSYDAIHTNNLCQGWGLYCSISG